MTGCAGCGASLGPDAKVACPSCENPLGPFRAIQLGLIGTVLLALLVRWFLETPFTATDEGGETTAVWDVVTAALEELQRAWAGGAIAQVVLVVLSLVALGSLVVCAWKGPWMLLSLRLALREPLGVPAKPRRLLMGGFLLAFLLLTLGEGFVLLGLLPSAQLAIEGSEPVRMPPGALTFGPHGPETPRTLRREGEGWVAVDPKQVERWGPEHIDVAALTTDQAVILRWEMAQARIEVRGGALAAIDGEAFSEGALLAPSGSRLRVGEFEAVLDGPTWPEVVRASALGKVVALALLLIGCAAMGGRELLSELGLVRAGWKTELKRGAVALWAFLPAYFILSLVTLWLGKQIGVPVENHPLVQAVQREGLGLFALVVLQAVVFAPILEELLFRGILIGAAQRSVGKLGALIVSAVGFALLHVGFASLLPMLGLGLLFGAIRISSPNQSILGAILAHGAFNGLTLTVLFASLV